MDYKNEFLSNDDFPDIPPAEEEIVLDETQNHQHLSSHRNSNNYGLNSVNPDNILIDQINSHNFNVFAPPSGPPVKRMAIAGSGSVHLDNQNITPTLKACVVPRCLLNNESHLRTVLGSSKKLFYIPRSKFMSTAKLNNSVQVSQPSLNYTASARAGIVSSPVGRNMGTRVIVGSNTAKIISNSCGRILEISGQNSSASLFPPTPIPTRSPASGIVSMGRPAPLQNDLGDVHHGNGLMQSHAPPINICPPMPAMSITEEDPSDPHGTMSYKTSGLRKYAKIVCDKVKEKGQTSYGEVADELVEEYAAEHPMIPQEQMQYIQKNIRRRVYDALNVLMSLRILTKERKEIKWKGLPTNLLQDCQELEQIKQQRLQELIRRNREIEELTLQLIALKNLILRNRLAQSRFSHLSEEVVDLPFLVVLTNRRTTMDCTINNDRQEYYFQMDQAFEIRDDMDMLKRMGLTLRLGERDCTEDEFNQCLELVPPSLRIYVQALYEQRPAISPNFERLHYERREQRVHRQQRHKQVHYQQQQQLSHLNAQSVNRDDSNAVQLSGHETLKASHRSLSTRYYLDELHSLE